MPLHIQHEEWAELMLFRIRNIHVFWHSECNAANQTLYYCFFFYVTLLSLMDKVPSDQLRNGVLILPFIFSMLSSDAGIRAFYLSQNLDTLQQKTRWCDLKFYSYVKCFKVHADFLAVFLHRKNQIFRLDLCLNVNIF